MKKRVMAVLLIALIFSAAFPLSSFAAKNCLNKTKVNMTAGSSIQLKLKCKTGKVKWSSSKKSVATVSKKGKVKAHKKGTAYITARVRGKKYKCRIIVKEPPDSYVYITPYLKPTKNCQVGNSKIKSMTNSMCAGLTTDLAKATAIFNYVRDKINTVSYEEIVIKENEFRDYHNVTFGNETKYGAVGTLDAKEGNDTDKTHLLIAMLRTAGIPARYCHGSCKFIGITHDITQCIKGNDYTDHVWAECLINDRWVQVDATCDASLEAYSSPLFYESPYMMYGKSNSFGKIMTWDTKDYKLHGYYDGLNF